MHEYVLHDAKMAVIFKPEKNHVQNLLGLDVNRVVRLTVDVEPDFGRRQRQGAAKRNQQCAASWESHGRTEIELAS